MAIKSNKTINLFGWWLVNNNVLVFKITKSKTHIHKPKSLKLTGNGHFHSKSWQDEHYKISVQTNNSVRLSQIIFVACLWAIFHKLCICLTCGPELLSETRLKYLYNIILYIFLSTVKFVFSFIYQQSASSVYFKAFSINMFLKFVSIKSQFGKWHSKNDFHVSSINQNPLYSKYFISEIWKRKPVWPLKWFFNRRIVSHRACSVIMIQRWFNILKTLYSS